MDRRIVGAQTDTIAALTRQAEMLTARLSRLETDNASLRAENATLREKLLPPKTPDNQEALRIVDGNRPECFHGWDRAFVEMDHVIVGAIERFTLSSPRLSG